MARPGGLSGGFQLPKQKRRWKKIVQQGCLCEQGLGGSVLSGDALSQIRGEVAHKKLSPSTQ